MNFEALLAGYLSKEAGAGELAGAAVGGGLSAAGSAIPLGTDIARKASIALLAGPILAGVPMGLLASKASAPSDEDLKNLQKKMLNAELKKALAALQRQEELTDMKEDGKNGTKRQREIHL